jgi:hypothetical protein
MKSSVPQGFIFCPSSALFPQFKNIPYSLIPRLAGFCFWRIGVTWSEQGQSWASVHALWFRVM